MFKLKRIELLGFKSFADRTRLDFADGTAAVVGPNGCGKSNLSDAITWVLGEQSAKSLRGERMADVIFNGTSRRSPTSMAEASLTLIDPEYAQAGAASEAHDSPDEGKSSEVSGTTPGEAETGETAETARPGTVRHRALKRRAGEITVTRRLFRSGESEYLINGEACRLRDIQDLFMGTGLGPESYAIIEQGRIGQILSSKPSDRRAILEEAAGISKFKTRKRLAEAKLEASRQNLARINDILQEVTKQINSLRRQAGKARRYREMHEELRKRLRLVLTSRLLSLDSECRRLRGDLEAAVVACAGASRELETLEHEERDVRSSQEQLDGRLTGLRQSIAQTEVEHERLNSRVGQVDRQRADLETRTGEATAEASQIQGEIERTEQEAREQAAQAAAVRTQWGESREVTRELQGKESDLAKQVFSGEADLEGCRRQLLAMVSKAAELENRLVKAEEMGLAVDRQLSRLASDQAMVEQEHQRLALDLEAFEGEHQLDEVALGRLSEVVSETTESLNQSRAEESRVRADLERLRNEFSSVNARKLALEESLERHAYTTETVRRLLTNPIPINSHHFRPMGVLADFVEVTPGYEEVVEEFLKDELDYVVVEGHEEARSGIALLRSEGSGRSTFFVTRLPTGGHSDSHSGNGHDGANENRLGGTEHVSGGSSQAGQATGVTIELDPPAMSPAMSEGVVSPVRDLVRFETRLGLNGDMVLPALEHAYLVEDGAAAERLASAYPEAHFLTKSGEHYHHRLVAGGRGKSAGPLALRRDFRTMQTRSAELEERLRGLESGLTVTAERVSHLEKELHALTESRREAEKKSVLGEEKLRQLREAVERAARRRQALETEITNLGEERQSIRLQQSSAREQMELAIAKKRECEVEVDRRSGQLRELRVRLDEVKTDLIEARGHSSTLEERTRSLEAELRRIETRSLELRSRAERLGQQCIAWREEQVRLAEERQQAELRLSEVEKEQETAKAEVAQLERELGVVRARLHELFPLIDGARAGFESRRQARSDVEVALARAESGLEHGAEQCREELKVEPEALLMKAQSLVREPEGENKETLPMGEALVIAEQQLDELKRRIEDLGPVNMMALEELQESEERFAFLDTQRQDLTASVEDTMQVIREIDMVSREQFLEAFRAINLYFAETFKTLFGGGTGQMRLSDENDPESGIEMVAQPPGKRLQNVLLLSGGEKALTALALLISMFRYTPSPFCVLDEVDAPLDESNVERFTRLIEQMSKHTQFILITHNRRTMEIAKLLYGVTMEEPGVSKMVSVRFEEAAA